MGLSLLRKLINEKSGITVAAILALGLIWRLIYFYEILQSPYGNNLTLDSLIHHDWAVKLSSGQWLHDEVFFRAPLYPYFLGLIYSVFNNSQTAAKLIQMLLGCLSCLLIYHIAKKVFNPKTALIALVLSSFYGMFMYFENELLIVSLIIFLGLLAFLCLIKAGESSKLSHWFLAGLFLGLSAIARPNILLFVVCLPPWIYFILRQKTTLQRIRQFTKFTVMLAMGCIIPILPVTLHNYFVGKDSVLIASQGGLNFYIGNNPESDGRTAVAPGTRDTWWGGYEDQISKAKKGLGNPNAKPSEISRFWYTQGLTFILNEPLTFFKLMLKKLYFFWNAHEIGNNRGIHFVTRYSSIFIYFTFKFWLVCPLAIAGIFLSLRRKLNVSLLLIFVISYMVSIVIFFVCARYRMPVIPFLIVFASYAVYEWLQSILSNGHFRELVRQPTLRTSVATFVVVALVIQPITVSKGDTAAGYFNEGEAYRMKNDFYNAIKCYEKAKSINPGYLKAHINMGNVYMDSLNNYGAAEKIFLEAAQISPTSHRLFYNMGILYLKMQDREKARQYFLRSLELNSSFAKAHAKLGQLYEIEGDLEKALSKYVEAAACDPKSDVFYVQIGNVYTKLNKLPEARDAFGRALQINPNFAGAHINLGETYLREGALHKAISHYRRAVQINPNEVMGYNNMGVALREMGRWEEALSCFDKAIDLKLDFCIGHRNKANLLFTLERYQRAADSYLTMLRLCPESTEAWYNLGVAYEKLNMPDKAESCYSRLLKMDPKLMSSPNGLNEELMKTQAPRKE